MNEILLVVLLTGGAGLMIPLGGWLGAKEHLTDGHLRKDLHSGIIALGAGALFAAVALVLVPDAVKSLGVGLSVLTFILGTLTFLTIDVVTDRLGTSVANPIAMGLDFFPESLALGAAFAVGTETGFLLALLIALQNLPEGFNSYRELAEADVRPMRIHLLLAAMLFLGPMAGVIGFLWLGGLPSVVGAVAMFASGGILFAVFHDLAPESVRNCHYSPTLGASLGFLIGVIGHAVLV
ncbi:MAG: divalent cation transporter [Euryarchaeota archaeon]|nr:divalent cation transporter [Euryarchaeota archaeon]